MTLFDRPLAFEVGIVGCDIILGKSSSDPDGARVVARLPDSARVSRVCFPWPKPGEVHVNLGLVQTCVRIIPSLHQSLLQYRPSVGQ